MLIPKSLQSQEGFRIFNHQKKKERVYFKLINNLIVIPLTINNKKLNFILDSGVGKTILFNLNKNDSIGLNSVEKVTLRGLGKGNSVQAILSKNNKISVKQLVSLNETIFVILKDNFDFSNKMGITIHGIIGHSILSNFVVKVNYKRRFIDFFKPNDYTLKKCKKCEVFPIRFYRRKPFIDIKVQLDTIDEKYTDIKVLVDSGSSNAIWLFENTKKEIKTPKKYFRDLLGEGLSGTIYGNRSRIKKVKLKSFEIKEPTVSFLDSLSTKDARNFKQRNGSIGSNILKRFVVWFDYPHNRLMLKKNGSFKTDFNYNMSGLEVIYSGKKLVKEVSQQKFTDSYNQGINANNSVQFYTSYSYRFKPSFKIKNVLENSPAALAGLQINDIILKINNRPAHELKLSDITRKFQEKDGKTIRMVVERKGKVLKFQFKLEKKV